MRVCGVIAEYDPFHSGHAYHLARARALTRADFIVCVMSGAFTQRGMPALLCAHDRARMALACGADIVLSPPCAFSVCDGERFALGGMAILRALGCVTHVSFGVEPAGLKVYQRAADYLEDPPEAFQAALKDGLARGLSFPRARGEALAAGIGASNDTLSQPNTALAICYARAARRLGCGFTLAPVPRYGDYHDDEIGAGYASATAVREAALQGAWADVRRAMPPEAYDIFISAFDQKHTHPPEALDMLLRYVLRAGGDFSHLPSAAEGIENLLPKAAFALSREEMLAVLKSKRYTRARLNRLLTEALLRLDARDIPDLPPYAYLLGFKRSASPLLRSSAITLKNRLDPLDASPLSLQDKRADDLWLLGAGAAFGAGYREKPFIAEDAAR